MSNAVGNPIVNFLTRRDTVAGRGTQRIVLELVLVHCQLGVVVCVCWDDWLLNDWLLQYERLPGSTVPLNRRRRLVFWNRFRLLALDRCA